MDRNDIEDWLKSYVGTLLKVSPAAVDAGATFERLGLDSASAVALVGDLEDWLGAEVDPVVAYDYPTIEKLASYLAERPEIRARNEQTVSV